MNRTRSLAGLLAAAFLTLTLVGCSSSGDDGSSASSDDAADSGAAGLAAPEAPAPEGEAADATGRQQGDPADTADPGVAQSPRSLIRTGTVALRAEDVARARFEVQKVVDAAGGEVGEESTSADADGDAEFARLVVRVPSSRFAETMTELEAVADLITTDTATEDVTTQVIDTDVRVKLQRRSIDRLSALLGSAGDLGEIIRLEQELSRREADLASLEQQQAYLEDQTSFSTITVSLERPAEKDDKEKEKKKDDDTDEAGFLSGLEAGWGALATATTGLLTVAGALLPFAVVVLVLGAPVLVLLRRRRRGAVVPAP